MKSFETSIGRYSLGFEEQTDYEMALTRLDGFSEDSKAIEDIIDIVGVLADIKPASVVADRPHLIETLMDLQLSLRTVKYGPEIPRRIVLSKEPAICEQLALELMSGGGNSAAWIRRVGALFGYAPSAIDYYIERVETIRRNFNDHLPAIEPIELAGTVRGRFRFFQLSPNHWREEIDHYFLPMERAAQELTPAMYSRVRDEVCARKAGRGTLSALEIRNFKQDSTDDVDIEDVA